MLNKKIPKDLDAAISAIIKHLGEDELLLDAYNMQMDDFIAWSQYNLSDDIGQLWGIWNSTGNLYRLIKSIGVWNVADQVSLILKLTWQTMHCLPIDLYKHTAEIKEYWMAQEIEME